MKMRSWSLPVRVGRYSPCSSPLLPRLLVPPSLPLPLPRSDMGARVSDSAMATARWRHSVIAQGRGTHSDEEEGQGRGSCCSATQTRAAREK